jgi:aryl-alcohol dehydrogenase-like predicted oxidoreductase
MTGIKVIFGGAMISSNRVFKDKDDLEALLASLKKYGVKAIDTAQRYDDCEQMLGSVNAGSQFIIDTKWKGGIAPGSSTKENIVATAEESMKKLKMDKVRTSLLSLPFLVLLVPIK